MSTNSNSNKLLTKKNIEIILNKVIDIKKLNYKELDTFFGSRLSSNEIEILVNSILNINKNENSKISIKNIEPYRRAFVHKSFLQSELQLADNTIYKPDSSNERLEFLGDSIVGACTAHYLYFKYPHENEGFLTRMRSRIVRSDNLANFAIWLGFKEFLILAENIDRNNHRFYEDSFEAFIGAIIEDFGIFGGLIVSYLFMKGIIEKLVNFNDLIFVNDNYKDILLRYFQSQNLNKDKSMKWGQPKYIDLYAKGQHHAQTFTVCTVLDIKITKSLPATIHKKISLANDRYLKTILNDISEDNANKIIKQLKKDNKVIIGMGTGKSKKHASQIASKEALINLGQLNTQN